MRQWHESERLCVNARLRLMVTVPLRQAVMIRLLKESSMSVTSMSVTTVYVWVCVCCDCTCSHNVSSEVLSGPDCVSMLVCVWFATGVHEHMCACIVSRLRIDLALQVLSWALSVPCSTAWLIADSG